MATTTRDRSDVGPDQVLEMFQITWDQYTTISDALVDRHQPRMIYLDGRLTLLATARPHVWYAERLGDLVILTANALQIEWEVAGQTTFRRADRNAGLEGDKTYYFREHAEIMKGPREIDLYTQPPPDLAIEVEVNHPADLAVSAWGRLGVPEIWRCDANRGNPSFWKRQPDGSYTSIERSLAFPVLSADDVGEQIALARSLGSSAWYIQFPGWARDVLAPRLGNGR